MHTSFKVPYVVDVVAERCIVPAMERMSRRDPDRVEMMSPLDRLRNSMFEILYSLLFM